MDRIGNALIVRTDLNYCEPEPALVRALDDCPALGRADAQALADQIGDVVITALQRDRSLPTRTAAQWRIALADVLQRVAAIIHYRIAEHVHRGDVARALDP
jgi:hypothetical protein